MACGPRPTLHIIRVNCLLEHLILDETMCIFLLVLNRCAEVPAVNLLIVPVYCATIHDNWRRIETDGAAFGLGPRRVRIDICEGVEVGGFVFRLPHIFFASHVFASHVFASSKRTSRATDQPRAQLSSGFSLIRPCSALFPGERIMV